MVRRDSARGPLAARCRSGSIWTHGITGHRPGIAVSRDPHAMTDLPHVPSTPSALPRWSADRFDVPCNESLLQRLLDDMARNAGALMPAPAWRLPDARARGGLAGLLDDWIGGVGARPLADMLRPGTPAALREVLEQGMNFVRAVDHCGDFSGLGLEDLAQAGWRAADLGSAIDMSLITAFHGWQEGAEVLEVGGGFGRLPEYFARSGVRFRYVNIDAVPASLMYCHEYLRRHCPDREVLLYLDDDASRAALARGAELVVVPAWHAEALLRDRRFDLCLNVDSFQEMDQPLVDHYLGLFDRVARDDALVYMMNARNYMFRGEYRYPAHWECLFRHHTLRSWSGDQPLEMHRVGRQPAAAVSRLREFFYQRERAAERSAPQYRPGRQA